MIFVNLFFTDFRDKIAIKTMIIVNAETIANPKDILSNNSPIKIANVVKIMHSDKNIENINITPYNTNAEVLLVFT